MKNIILVLWSFILMQQVSAQDCFSGGCNSNTRTTQVPSSTLTPSSSWGTTWPIMSAGNYAAFNVVNGNTYEWSTCGEFGGTQQGNLDAQLTLFNNSWVRLCYSDNSNKPNCPNAPYLRWIATYTGVVYVLLNNEWTTSCTNTPAGQAIIAYRQSASGGCTNWYSSPTSLNLSSNSSCGNNFNVYATGTCNYYSVSNNSWIHSITYPGNGVTRFCVDANPGSQRTGTISVRDAATNNLTATFTVYQAAGSQSCTPVRITSDPQNQSKNIGQTATFSVSVSGTSPFTYQWRRNGSDIQGATSSSYTTPVLTLSNNGDTYRCRVTNCNGDNIAMSSSATLIVENNCTPVSISQHPQSQTRSRGQTATFSVSASGTGPFAYQWRRNGNNIPGETLSSYRTSALTLSNNGDVYTCRITNCNGNNSIISSSAILTVKDGTTETPKQQAIQNLHCQKLVSDPIQVGTCTYMYAHDDVNLPVVAGNLAFSRFYNSQNNNRNSPLGYGWSHSFNYHIEVNDEEAWEVYHPDGHAIIFIPIYGGNGTSLPLHGGVHATLTKDGSGNYKMTAKDETEYNFNSSGRLVSIKNPNGNTTNLTYSGNNLSSVQAPGGRTITITNSNNRITRITDPLGRQTNYAYDANGNLTTVTDAKNGQTNFTYDSNHRLLSVINPLGVAVLTNTYDAQGRAVAQTDADNQTATIAYDVPSTGFATITFPDGTQNVVEHDTHYRLTYSKDELNKAKSYVYNVDHRPVSITNEANQIETRQYDDNGNLLQQTLPGNRTTSYTYNSFSKPLQVTDPLGKVTTFGYNAKGELTSVNLPDNTQRSFAYNANGTLGASTDGRGNTVTYSYNASGDLTQITAPNGNRALSYDAAGRPVTMTDERGNVSAITYDNNDNITLIRDALGQELKFAYNADNKLTAFTDKKGKTTTFEYDVKGRQVLQKDPMNGTIAYTYDVRDRLASATDAKGNTVSFAYDAKGRMIGRTDAGGTTHLTYDDLGNVLTSTDASGSVTTFTYTLSNQVASVTDALGNKQMLAYDANGNLLSVTDALGKSTQYAYDAVNRLTGVTDADGKVTAIAYDANGNVVSLTDPNGHAQSYTYDASNRLTTYKDGAGNTYGYTYDAVGNITQLAKPTGTIASTYDALNRLTRAVNSSGDTYTFAYDANDNIVSMGNGAGTTALVYADLNRLTTYTDPYNNQVEFEYDAAGNKTAVTYPGNKVVRYTYDNAHRMQTVTDWKGNVYSYTYDAEGRVKKLNYPNGISCDYIYDAAGRLKEKKNIRTADGTVISGSVFTLDAAGRRVQEERQGAVASNIPAKDLTYTYSPNDALLSDGETTYANDPAGNRISQSGGGATLSYDFTVDNLLTSSSDGSVATVYTYNPLGHRIQKSQGGEAVRYVLDLSGELSLVLQTTDEAGAVQSDYIYGLGLLARIGKEDKIQLYHFDAQHNTVALTDADGNITDTYTYDPFGTMLSHEGETEQPFTFLGSFGVEQESEGLYYVRARYYAAENGRFLSVDPYPYSFDNPQTINRYIYSLNDPLRMFDYNGLYGSYDWNDVALDVLSSVGENLAEELGGFWGKGAMALFEGLDLGLLVHEYLDAINENMAYCDGFNYHWNNFALTFVTLAEHTIPGFGYAFTASVKIQEGIEAVSSKLGAKLHNLLFK